MTRNENYWKKGLLYLDGIEFTIIPNRSTAILAFIAGKFDMTYPTEVTIPLLKDVKTQAPNAVCVVAPTNVSTNIIVNSSNLTWSGSACSRTWQRLSTIGAVSRKTCQAAPRPSAGWSRSG